MDILIKKVPFIKISVDFKADLNCPVWPIKKITRQEAEEMYPMNINEQVRIIEAQIHSKVANFTLMEKMQYLTEYFGNDSMFSKEAQDIVRSNICRSLKPAGG